MMETKHTPTPWEFGIGLVSVKQIAMFFGPPLLHPTSRHVGQVFGGDSPQSHANAAFIVRAVNNHEALIHILEQMLDEIACRNSASISIPAAEKILAAAKGAK